MPFLPGSQTPSSIPGTPWGQWHCLPLACGFCHSTVLQIPRGILAAPSSLLPPRLCPDPQQAAFLGSSLRVL